MAYLNDTSVLGRLGNTGDPLNAVAAQAVALLHRQNETLHITAQNLVEYRNMATRPLAVNGLGFTCAEAEADIRRFEAQFPLLEETPEIYRAWKTLVEAAGVNRQTSA